MAVKCCTSKCRHRLELMVSILLSIWNNTSTIINAVNLYQHQYTAFSYLTVFFLFFPGIVTSFSFVILHFIGHKKIGKLPPLNVFLFFIGLLCFYPTVSIILPIYSLCTGKKFHIATLARLLEGFLDDGPQFVLRLVIVVLYNIKLNNDSFDILIFNMSIISSFFALVFFGLKFNERRTFFVTKLLICLPMFCTFVLARAFTLAVFLKETLGNTKEYVGAFGVMTLFCFISIVTFRYCGQDWTRSALAGISSLLIPAGYGNDPYFYQCPHQHLSKPKRDSQKVSPNNEPPLNEDTSIENDKDIQDACKAPQEDFDLIERLQEESDQDGNDSNEKTASEKLENLKQKITSHDTYLELKNRISSAKTDVNDKLDHIKETVDKDLKPRLNQVLNQDLNILRPKPKNATQFYSKMRSGLFLLLYTFSNVILLLSCTIYLMLTRDLTITSDNALILPQLLSLIPGCLFAISRSVLMEDLSPKRLPKTLWAPISLTISIIFCIAGYASLFPAVFWSAFYKLII